MMRTWIFCRRAVVAAPRSAAARRICQPLPRSDRHQRRPQTGCRQFIRLGGAGALGADPRRLEGGTRASARWPRRSRRKAMRCSLLHFGPGAAARLDQIPLETFGRGLAWLAAQPSVDRQRIGALRPLQGGRGGLARRDAPSRDHAVTPPRRAMSSGPACAALHAPVELVGGRAPVPFVPYDMSRGFTSIFSSSRTRCRPGAACRTRSSRSSGSTARSSSISGGADGLWPATAMADAIVARLRANNFRHRVEPRLLCGGRPYGARAAALRPTRAETLPMVAAPSRARPRPRGRLAGDPLSSARRWRRPGHAAAAPDEPRHPRNRRAAGRPDRRIRPLSGDVRAAARRRGDDATTSRRASCRRTSAGMRPI